MHCDRCNIDFPEGLRYCKWCGGTLIDRPRVTSELHSCPSCSSAVKPGWAYCKSCGERLQAPPREPVSAVCPRCGALTDPGSLNCLRCGGDLTGERAERMAKDAIDTSAIAMCPSCGELMEAGSLYCKACGSALYTQQVPFGGSALLCGACNSYSPFGSQVCRVCGAPFAQAPKTVVDRSASAPAIQEKPKTLRDLDERLPETASALVEETGVNSGANTAIITSAEREEQATTSRNKGTAQTNFLPGTAGAKSEQQAPTAIMQGRTTGPVDEQPSEVTEAEIKSGALEIVSAADLGVETTSAGQEKRASDRTAEFLVEPSTVEFGAETASPYAGQTEVFVSPSQEAPPSPHKQVSEDEVQLSESLPSQRPPETEPTKEIPQIRRGMTGDHLRLTVPMSSAPEGTNVEPEATREFSPIEVAQVASQPLPKKRTGGVIASLVVSLIVIGAAVYVAWWLVFSRGRPVAPVAPPVVNEPRPATPEPPAKPPAPAVPEGMLTVAAGTYTLGRDGADPLEQPQHKVELPAFFIDRTEVTNSAYKKFLDATGHKPPANWNRANFPQGRDNFPVTSVTWQDAADYAAWAGKRLPTEAEWEAAARGADGRIYPWGKAWRTGVANIGLKSDDISADQYPSGMVEVGKYPEGASPVGAMDMIGNAWEWVADEIQLYPGNTEGKLNLESGVTYRVIRGGAYDGNKVNDATYRGYLDAKEAYPKVGFRCAKDAK